MTVTALISNHASIPIAHCYTDSHHLTMAMYRGEVMNAVMGPVEPLTGSGSRVYMAQCKEAMVANIRNVKIDEQPVGPPGGPPVPGMVTGGGYDFLMSEYGGPIASKEIMKILTGAVRGVWQARMTRRDAPNARIPFYVCAPPSASWQPTTVASWPSVNLVAACIARLVTS